jgi:hypothetical protein
MELNIPSSAGVPYSDPLTRCQQKNTLWCGQNHVIAIYPQVEDFNGPADNTLRTQGGYDIAQLRLDSGRLESVAANSRSGFNITQFQLDIGLVQAEGGRLLSETGPIGVIQSSTFGPEGGIELSAASFSRRCRTLTSSAIAAVISVLALVMLKQ